MKVSNFVIVFFLSALIPGCAVKDQAKPYHVAMEQEEAIVIAPSSFYEACDKMTAGQKMAYSFQTTSPVNFNVHYHSKTEGIVHLVKEDNIASASGDMVVDVEAICCCMWSNKLSTPVTLTHEFKTLASEE